MLITNSIVLLTAIAAQQAYAATITSSGYAAQVSPTFPGITVPKDAPTSYNEGSFDTTTTLSTTRLQGFPQPWSIPPTDSAEVKAAYNSLDWTKVPNAPVRKQKSDGSWTSTSDGPTDPYCWWSSTNCLKPKASYLPPDIYTCPNKGDWGLNYDDGPFNRYTDENAAKENPYAEPALYNFLVKHNVRSTLFYIGSNVVNYPAAALRALQDNQQLCVHSFSHQPMTTLTNVQIVSELYWTLKAIKAATGVTSKCWRPPQGDVDDRVRSIAWQMGMRTILWDADSEDWQLPATGGGTISPKKVDAFFQGWIDSYQSGKDTTGRIVLQHELNSATVNMSMFWMPKLQQVFNVVPALSCNGITQPYWEKNFVYPTSNSDKPPTIPTTTATTTTTTKAGTSTATSTATTAPGTCTAGSAGLGNGDGYNGACCNDQADCQDDCISGACNGPVNPQITTKVSTTTTVKVTTTTAKATTTTTVKATTTIKATTTTKKTTTTTTKVTKPTTPSKCTGTSAGKGNGDGITGACCKTSDDCQAVCRPGGICDV